LKGGDIINKKIKFYLLDDTVRTVMWHCIKPQVNNLILLNKH